MIKTSATVAATVLSGHIPGRGGAYEFVVLGGLLKGTRFSTRQPEQGFAIGNYELEVSRAIHYLTNSGDVVFDIGANVGWDTIIASRRVGQGQVVAFEPGEDNLKLLKYNLSLNELHNVQIVPTGVGARTELVTFAEYGYGLVNHVVTDARPSAPDANIREVEAISIDDFVKSHGIVPTLLKIDVEGHELEVIQGAMSTLETHKPTVVCEVRSDNWGVILDLMVRLGYAHRFLGGNGRGLGNHGLDDVLFTPLKKQSL